MPRRIAPEDITEDKVRDPVVRWAKANGIMHERNHKGRGAATGWPDDRFYFGSGHQYIIEFKRPVNAKTTERQKYIVRLLKAAGHDVDFHDQSDEAIRSLQERLGSFGGAGISSRTPHP